MRWDGTFVVRYAILHNFEAHTATLLKLLHYSMRWAESELTCFAKFECGKFRWKTKWLTTQASTVQQQVQIQITNFNDQMTLLQIYSKLAVILRQWWGYRIKISRKTSHVRITLFLLIFSDIATMRKPQTLNIKYMSLSSDIYIFINVYIYYYHF